MTNTVQHELPLGVNLNDFDFSSPVAGRKQHGQKDYDMTVSVRTAGRKRKNFGCDIGLTSFIQRMELETVFKKMAVGVNRFKKQSTVLAVFDNDEIPEYGLINRAAGKNPYYMINNKPLTIKILNAFNCEIPDRPDCDVRLCCKLIQLTPTVFSVQPVKVDYTDANDTVITRHYKNGVLEGSAASGISQQVTAKKF